MLPSSLKKGQLSAQQLAERKNFLFTCVGWFPNFLIGLTLKHFKMGLYVVFSAQRRLVDKLSNSLITQSKCGAAKSSSQDFHHFTQWFDSAETTKLQTAADLILPVQPKLTHYCQTVGSFISVLRC